jgi:5-methyltetrahydrofolate--homocysteine methyltransferase
VTQLHESYILAGAQIIKTNTFNSNSISLQNSLYQHKIIELNCHSVELAKNAAQKYSKIDNPIYIAGVIGPTPLSLSQNPLEISRFQNAILEQVEVMHGQKIDLFLIETTYDLKNLMTAFKIINKISQIPVMVSLTLNKECTHIASGETIEEIIDQLKSFNLFSLGINCSFGPDHLEKTLTYFHQNLSIPISLHPNAGIPDKMGNYSYSPVLFSEKIEKYLKKGLVNLIGGCCGTTPEHIKKINELSKKYQPRKLI